MKKIEQLKIALQIMEAEERGEKVKLEYQPHRSDKWVDTDQDFFYHLFNNHTIRIKPKPEWKLPKPPPGQQWHRNDWTEEMLPPGYRPLLLGEQEHREDEFFYKPTSTWCDSPVSTNDGATWCDHHRRTKRPLPQEPEYIPLDADDVVAGMEFMKSYGKRFQWGMIDPRDIGIRINGAWYSMQSLMEDGWKYRIGDGEWKLCRKEKPNA